MEPDKSKTPPEPKSIASDNKETTVRDNKNENENIGIRITAVDETNEVIDKQPSAENQKEGVSTSKSKKTLAVLSKTSSSF